MREICRQTHGVSEDRTSSSNVKVMSTVKPMYEWNKTPWRKLEKVVFKLQKRIYQAANRDDIKALRRLQKLLMKSWAAKCLAVRRVTQDNRGVRREVVH